MRPSHLLFGGLLAAQLAYPQLPARRHTAATRGIVGLMLATSVADLVESRGRRRAAAMAGASASIGMAAEWTGVRTGRPFGPYDYSGRLGPKVADVPVLAAAAWTMMARPSWVAAGLVTERRAARVALAAAALTAWDVFLDPRMVREGYWTWHDGGAYEDVPLSNYAGWFATGAAIFAVWSVLEEDDAPARDGDLALGLYLWTWIGEAVANVVFWGRPKVALAGGLAMGAVAVPALRARLGRR